MSDSKESLPRPLTPVNQDNDVSSLPEYIRVPLNIHPSHLNTPIGYGALHDDSSYYLSGATVDHNSNSLAGSPSSGSFFRGFAGSYSRTSALYMAENLSIHHRKANDTLSVRSEPAMAPTDFLGDQESSSIKAKLLPMDHTLTQTISQHGSGLLYMGLSRHTTVASIMSLPVMSSLKSSFVQSVFNSINVLVGIGVLALPLAFRCAGWLIGSLVFLFCVLATNYTAKILAKCLDFYPNSTTYGDMGAAAFGDRGRTFVSAVFVVELMTIGVAMVVLLGDGVQTLFPHVNMMTIRVASFVVLTPMLFLPIRKLAYTSLIGILSCSFLVVIVLYDGLSKKERPGSLIDPMETEIIPSELYNIPLSFGLMMAGFAGHAVFPAIYRDMENPKQYENMVDLTYVITVAVYITMAIAGYAMFGLETMQEITQNLASTPGYSKWINRAAVWLIVLTPLAKYGLMMNPVSVTWELWITSYERVEMWCKYSTWRRSLVAGTGRVFASLAVILIATVFPGFDRIMSLLGALFSFGISAIFPLVCYIRLFHNEISTKETILVYCILTISICMALLGTIWSFLPNEL